MDKEISLAALEQELADEEAFAEIDGDGDTEEMAVPQLIDDDETRTTAPYEIAKPSFAAMLYDAGDVYWVPLAS